MKSIFAVHTI